MSVVFTIHFYSCCALALLLLLALNAVCLERAACIAHVCVCPAYVRACLPADVLNATVYTKPTGHRLVCLIKGPNSTTATPCFQVLYNLSTPCTPHSAHCRINLFRHTVVHGSVDITPYKSQTLPDTYLSVHTRVQLLYVYEQFSSK